MEPENSFCQSDFEAALANVVKQVNSHENFYTVSDLFTADSFPLHLIYFDIIIDSNCIQSKF